MTKHCFCVNQTNNRVIYWWSLSQRGSGRRANRPPPADTRLNWVRGAAACLRRECLSNLQPKTNFTSVVVSWYNGKWKRGRLLQFIKVYLMSVFNNFKAVHLVPQKVQQQGVGAVTDRLWAGSSSAVSGFPPRSRTANTPLLSAAPEPKPRGEVTGRPSRSRGKSRPCSSFRSYKKPDSTCLQLKQHVSIAMLIVNRPMVMTCKPRRCCLHVMSDFSRLITWSIKIHKEYFQSVKSAQKSILAKS